MIPWWGWLLMWTGLVLTLLIVLSLLAYRLFRKAISVMHELSAVVDKTAILDGEAAELSSPQIAILAEMSAIRAHHESQRQRRIDLKRDRHDRRIARAKRITKRDASTVQWPESWS
ncbi:hypothetical protein [Salinibacterium sp. M195]|uniref:hypothetical protein n=1 Tax=Salinibacterium sp. M195 TaxID=2583374 RepID=UPI001C6259B1|nr:hypothetical protein [Salinibacterium sp. M195]QYH36231.1 hypothetical protein FFT87_09840 [Salinibacterium sp. M195]